MFIISKPSFPLPYPSFSLTLCIDLGSHISHPYQSPCSCAVDRVRFIHAVSHFIALTPDQRYLVGLISPRWRANANHVSHERIECDNDQWSCNMCARAHSWTGSFIDFFLVYIWNVKMFKEIMNNSLCLHATRASVNYEKCEIMTKRSTNDSCYSLILYRHTSVQFFK